MTGCLSQREHARLARELIDACGGLDEATRNCRVCKSVLSTYQSPHEATSMPADVIDALEVYCGRAIYSSAMAGRLEGSAPSSDLAALACDFAERAVSLQALVRQAGADKRLTPREFDELAKAEAATEQALEELRAARRSAEHPRLVPQAV